MKATIGVVYMDGKSMRTKKSKVINNDFIQTFGFDENYDSNVKHVRIVLKKFLNKQNISIAYKENTIKTCSDVLFWLTEFEESELILFESGFML